MSDNQFEIEISLIQRVANNDACAMVELEGLIKSPLERIIRRRLDRRLQGRIDPIDIVQEAILEVIKRAQEYVKNPSMPLFLWIRFLTIQCLATYHRKHLHTGKRDVARDVPIDGRASPPVQGHLTSPTRAARRSEMQERVRRAIISMDEIDREVLILRHFEELSNAEVAEILGLRTSTASARYIAAMKRLRVILDGEVSLLED